MEGRRLALRIVGVACTTHGFAFAVTEGPNRLLDWGTRKTVSRTNVLAHLDAIVERARPLFVVCEMARNQKRSDRARIFNDALISVCTDRDIMIICVERTCCEATGRQEPTNSDIAEAVIALFPIIADKLPRQRKLWEGADDRIGIFLAAAAASAGWNHFRSSRLPKPEEPYVCQHSELSVKMSG